MANDKPSIKDQANRLYGSFYKLNMKLLKRSGKSAVKLSCVDVFDFYISSHALSLLKDIYFDLHRSLGFVLNARCILEGIALKRYCSENDDPLLPELLKKQCAILEYRCYNSFDGIKALIVIPEKIEADYQDSVRFYKDSLTDNRNYSESQIHKIVNSQIPFLCVPYTNYRKLIGEQLGEEYAKLYGILSQMVHPSLNDTYKNDHLLQSTEFVLQLLVDEYSDLPDSSHDLNFYCRAFMTSPVPVRLYEITRDELSRLNAIADFLEPVFESSFVSDTIKTIAIIRTEMTIDTVLGFREQTKSKWKILLDLYAAFYEVAIIRKCDSNLLELLGLHTQIHLQRNLGNEISTEKAFEVYRSIYATAVDKEPFEKSFLSVSGYTIDDNGHVKSLSRLVRDFSSQFEKNTNNTVLYEIYYMNYLESQLLSHANGYLWFANQGAWNDIHGLINGSNNGLLMLLNGILEIVKAKVSDQNRKEMKPTVNYLRNSIKSISEAATEGAKLLMLPTQSINNLQLD